MSRSENVGSDSNISVNFSRIGFRSTNPYLFIKHFKLSLTNLLPSRSANFSNISSILNPKAKNTIIIAPAEAPEYSYTLFNDFSIVLRYPKIENTPIAPGPIARYSMLSFSLNSIEEIAFLKERRRVRRRLCVPKLLVYLFDLTSKDPWTLVVYLKVCLG